MKKNGLRDDYIEIPATTSTSAGTGSEYWTDARVRRSGRYQYDVYLLATSIALESGAQTVVDLGCGVATKLNSFFPDPHSIVGVDTDEAVRKCKALHRRGVYLVEDLEAPRTQLRDVIKSADLIICSDVLEHLSKPSNLMKVICESTSQTARVVFSTPCREHLVGPNAIAPSNPAHCREWSMSEFRAFVNHFGFRVVQHLTQRPFRFGVNWMTVSFLANRLVRQLPLETTQVAVCHVN
jgi:2-polyprenyl-3-methyl-5-hydroxy-6-metoxy-1,4-benzoquinol methylase